MANALAVGVGVIEADEIDRINILQATIAGHDLSRSTL